MTPVIKYISKSSIIIHMSYVWLCLKFDCEQRWIVTKGDKIDVKK